MFRYNVRGESTEVTGAIHDCAEEEIGKLGRHFSDAPDATAHVSLKVHIERTAKVEVTIPSPYLVLRAEETSPNLYASINLVVSKLERQIRKFKTRINRKSHETGIDTVDATALFNEENENKNDSELDIAHTERLPLKPMDSEETVLQMNMLEHNLLIFEGAETSGTSIVYRRKDGEYGLIETD